MTMTPYNFGRAMSLKVAFQLSPNPPASGPAPTPTPASPPSLAAAPRRLTMKDLPADSPDQSGGLFGPAGYANTLSRWYNPWTTQTVTDPTEKAMMRVGQGALGLGAAAGVGAAGVAAAAPTLGSTAISQLPAYFAGNAAASTAATGGAATTAAAAANPSATQRLFPTVTGAINNASQFGSQMSQRVSTMSNQLGNMGNNAWNKLPQPAQKAITGYRDYVHTPMENASNAMGGDIVGSPTNTATKLTRDPMSFIPDSVSKPLDGAKSLSKTFSPTHAGVAAAY